MNSLRSKLAPLLPAVMLAASGCIYNVQPAPVPDIKPLATSLPLSVGIVDGTKSALGIRATTTAAGAMTAALQHTGLFRDVHDVTNGGSGGVDLVVQLTGKSDRTNNALFPSFLPFCDPLIIGCFPFYTITEKFTVQMQAQVSAGRAYNETGEAELKCQGTLGCAPASQGDPEARGSALENGAAKIAADFLRDAAFFRDFARSRQAASYEASRAVPEPAADPAAEPGTQPAPSAAPAAAPAGGQKPWWQN